MGARIQVMNTSNKPVAGADVSISWKGGGNSSGKTDKNGIFDTNVTEPNFINQLSVNRKYLGYADMLVNPSENFRVVLS